MNFRLDYVKKEKNFKKKLDKQKPLENLRVKEETSVFKKRICVTGSVSGYTRVAFCRLLQTRYECILHTSINSNTDYLIIGNTKNKTTSKMIGKLLQETIKQGDLAFEIASRYISEQTEEEQLFNSILNLYETCNGSKVDFEMEIGAIKCSGKYKLGSL